MLKQLITASKIMCVLMNCWNWWNKNKMVDYYRHTYGGNPCLGWLRVVLHRYMKNFLRSDYNSSLQKALQTVSIFCKRFDIGSELNNFLHYQAWSLRWKHTLLGDWELPLWLTSIKKTKKQKKQDFSGGPVVKNLPANAGDTGSIPGVTKPPCHNYWAHTVEPVLCNERTHCKEKPAHRNWRVASASCSEEYVHHKKPSMTENK